MADSCRSTSRLLASVIAVVFPGGCGSGSPAGSADGGSASPRDASSHDAPAPDGGVPGDAAQDSSVDATLDSSTNPTPDSSMDTGVEPPTDAALDALDADAAVSVDGAAGGSQILLLGINASGAFGATFQGSAWGPVTNIASHASDVAGGLTACPDGSAFGAFLASGSPLLLDEIWKGGWVPTGSLGTGNPQYISAPAATSQSVFVVAEEQPSAGSTGGIFLNTYDLAASTTVEVPIGVGGQYASPAVTGTAAGAPLVVASLVAGGYAWTLGSGGTWSAPASIPGITVAAFPPVDAPVLVERTGVDQIVGIFEIAVDSSSGTTLAASTFSAGAWGTATTIATDARFGRPPSVAALPDGRVALSYTNKSTPAVEVGFFDGTAWSAFATVPGISPSQFFPGAIAQGLAGDVLELVYIDASQATQHTRLTNESTWTWSAPIAVDPPSSYTRVFLAVP